MKQVMKSYLKNVALNEKGSQLVEQAIVFPLFLLLIVGFFDVSRFLTTETLLTKGAYDAAMLASRLPNIDTDLRGLDPDSNEYKRFSISRRMIIEEARKLPIATIVGEAGSVDPVRLLNFRMTDQASAEQTGVYDAAVIRPSECAMIEDGSNRSLNPADCDSPACNDNDPTCLKHPTVPPQSTGLAYDTNQKKLMENELMMVVLKSEVEMMLPGLGSMQAQGVGVARRQALPFSPFERVVEAEEGVTVDYAVEEPLAAGATGPEGEVRVKCSNAVINTCNDLYAPSGRLGYVKSCNTALAGWCEPEPAGVYTQRS